MKKILIGVLVVIVLGAAAYFYVDYKGQQELAKYEEEIKASEVATSTATTTLTTYTMAEVAVHNKKTDCWMVINGQVANLTSFIDKHPGGDRVLEGCGKDATALFNSIPQHSRGLAVIVLKGLIIGEVAK